MLLDSIFALLQIHMLQDHPKKKTDAIVHGTDAKFPCNGTPVPQMRTSSKILEKKSLPNNDPEYQSVQKKLPSGLQRNASIKSSFVEEANVLQPNPLKMIKIVRNESTRGTPVPQMRTSSKILEKKSLPNNDPEYQSVQKKLPSGLQRNASIKSSFVEEANVLQPNPLKMIKIVRNESTRGTPVPQMRTSSKILEKKSLPNNDPEYQSVQKKLPSGLQRNASIKSSFEEEANVLQPNPLKKIKIVRYESTRGAPLKMPPDFIIGDVQIYLICGNLLHEKTDVIVHCTDAKFSCNGAISRCLIKHFGRAFTDDCQRKSSEMMRNHFAVTYAHGLQCKMIFHLDIVSHLSEPEKILETCIFNAEKYGISSLSIPHLSTYGKSIPLDKMASAIVKVISKLKSRYLKQVNVVLYQAQFVSTLKKGICRAKGTPVLKKMPLTEIFKRKHLRTNDPEYRTVQEKFLSDLQRKASIKSIEKIINKPLKIQYVAQLQKIKALNPGSTPNERILWHGTKADIVEKICKDGFDRGYCGVNGTWHGQGVYFAVYSEYSDKDTFTPRDSNGYKHMLMCNVATGAYTQGTPTMKVLPTRPNSSQKYDSAVNNPKNPTVFIIFNDVQAYPAYYITYS